jgi:RNA polymerase sigma factor (TIGR02999 family)
MPPELTRLLNALDSDDSKTAEQLLPLVYEQLRRLAIARLRRVPRGQTLQATALVHEAWLRVQKSGAPRWNTRGHFFAASAEAMRRILVEQARRKSRQRHGGGLRRVGLDEGDIVAEAPEDKTLLIHDALDQLAVEDPLKAEIVKLKFFAGLNTDEIASVLQTSEKTVRRHWNIAKVRLFQLIEAARH